MYNTSSRFKNLMHSTRGLLLAAMLATTLMSLCLLASFASVDGDSLVEFENNGFNYRVIDSETVELTGYHGYNNHIEIDCFVYKGSTAYEIVSIGKEAFKGNKFIVNLSIKSAPAPSGDTMYGVKTIGESAFKDCSKLKVVRISDGVLDVKEHAFGKCKNLKEIWIPIGIDCCYGSKKPAFKDVNPTHLHLSGTGYDSEKYMDNEFWKPWCNSLENLYLGSGITDFNTSFKGKGLKEFVASDVKVIHESQFKDCKKLIGADTGKAEVIEKSAFENCEKLNTVLAPNVVNVGEKAFYKCKSLEIFESNKVNKVDEKAFCKCGSLYYFNFRNVNEIGNEAFKHTKVDKPEKKIDNIGKDAFKKKKSHTSTWVVLAFGGIVAAGAKVLYDWL